MDTCKCHSKINSKVEDNEKEIKRIWDHQSGKVKMVVFQLVITLLFALIIGAFGYTAMVSADSDKKIRESTIEAKKDIKEMKTDAQLILRDISVSISKIQTAIATVQADQKHIIKRFHK